MFHIDSPFNTQGTVRTAIEQSRRVQKFQANRPDILSAKVLPRKQSREEAVRKLGLGLA